MVGYLAGRVRQQAPWQGNPSATSVVLAVAASSFVGTSIFALGGLMLHDPVIEVSDMVTTILVALIWDVLLTPFVLPPVMLLFARMQPTRVAY